MKKMLMLIAALTAFSFAAQAPTAQETQKVLDYYYNGNGNAVLADVVICEKVEGNQPVNPVDPANLVKGKSYMLWMAYLVPQNQKNVKIMIQFNKGGMTRSMKNSTISGSFRYRTWKGFTPSSAGNWDIVIAQENGDDIAMLKKIPVVVQ